MEGTRELFDLLSAYLSQTGQVSALALRQARVLGDSALDEGVRAQAQIILLVNLAALGRGAPRASLAQLLEPLEAAVLSRHLDACTNGGATALPGWAAAVREPRTHIAVAFILKKALSDPGYCRPLTGPLPDPGSTQQTWPLLAIDQPAGRMGFSRYVRAAGLLEQNLARRLARPLDDVPFETAAATLGRVFGTEGSASATFDCRQAAAAALALRSRFMVLSGGPGTGKTTVVGLILRALLEVHYDLSADRMILCAPTGRAKTRLGESVEKDIAALMEKGAATERIVALRSVARKTLHGLLGVRSDGSFTYHAENPLPWRLIVVDEASMMDLPLSAALMEAAAPDCRIVLVGDMNQLPSIDAGALLGDLTTPFSSQANHPSLTPETAAWIAAVSRGAAMTGSLHDLAFSSEEAMRTAGPLVDRAVVLTRSFRSAGSVHELAARVNAGDADGACALLCADASKTGVSLDSRPGAAGVREWIAGHYAPQAVLQIRALNGCSLDELRNGVLDRKMEQAFAVSNGQRILTLANDGPRGRTAINQLAGRMARPLVDEGPVGRFFHGQPVMVTVNHYDLDLYNGDSGLVVRVAGGQLCAAFRRGSGLSVHAIERLPDLEPAFAVTVHKSQGSEYDAVLLVLPEYHSPLLNRQIIYTAVTRARLKVVVLGSGEILREAICVREERQGGVVLS